MASVVIAGDVSGTCTLQAANAAGTTTLTLPTTSGTLVATGGSPTFTTINATNVIASANSNAAVFTSGLGNASAPAYSFTGDTNTGIFSPTADTIAFTEGGVESMRIASNGYVGIGTNNPSSHLVVNSATATQFDLLTNGTRYFTAYTDPTQVILGGIQNTIVSFRQNDTLRMQLDTSGNLLFNSGYGSVATAYGCRAWVNFNGTGTPAIRASGNISSISDNGTGAYSVNFTTLMPDANYGGNVSVCGMPGVSDANFVTTDQNNTLRSNPTTSSFSFTCFRFQGSAIDPDFARVSIFR
jgi:hypothetical protein